MEAKFDQLLQETTANNAYPGIGLTVVDSTGNKLYHKAFGVDDISANPTVDYTTSTPTMIWSCTKLLTSIAALQLIEQGKLSLDDHASKYLPDIQDIPIIKAPSSPSDNITTTPPKEAITIRHLITHTAGWSYEFFNPHSLQWRIEQSAQPAAYIGAPDRAYYHIPRVFEAGAKFEYGINIDWLGFVIEAITSTTLPNYISRHILQPLGMTHSTTSFPPDGGKRQVMHVRGPTGTDPLTPMPEIAPPADLTVHGGGHYMVSTLDDYARLLATLLNNGTSPNTDAQILKAETVDKYLFADHIPAHTDRSGLLNAPATIPMLTNPGSFLPDTKLGWGCGLMVNLEDVPGGRRKGSGMWAGLGNLYYFVDRESGIAAMVMTSVLPFWDEGVLRIFGEVEREVCGKKGGEVGGARLYTVGA